MTDHSFSVSPAAVMVNRYSQRAGWDTDREPKVRVYRSSPDRVTLQIRTAKSSYATASLPFDIAVKIADALKVEAGEIR